MNILLVILMCLFCNPRIVIIGSLHIIEPIGNIFISIHSISLFRDFEKAFHLVDWPKECLCIVSLAYTRMQFKMFSSFILQGYNSLPGFSCFALGSIYC